MKRSKVTFDASQEGRGFEVTAGWDLPIQEFYLVVKTHSHRKSDEQMVPPALCWSSDFAPPRERRDIGSLKAHLTSLGLNPPEGFWERVARCESGRTYLWDPLSSEWVIF